MNLQVSFAEYRLFYRALLQKTRIILSILLTKATPYLQVSFAKEPYQNVANEPYQNGVPFEHRPTNSRSLRISINTLLAIRGCRPAIIPGLICKRALPKWGSFSKETQKFESMPPYGTVRKPSWHLKGVVYRSHLQKSPPKMGLFSKRDFKFCVAARCSVWFHTVAALYILSP